LVRSIVCSIQPRSGTPHSKFPWLGVTACLHPGGFVSCGGMTRYGEVNKGDEVGLTKMAPLKRRVEIWSIFGDRVAAVATKLKAPFLRPTADSDGGDDGDIPKRVACGFKGYETSRDENTDNRDWQKQIRRTFSPPSHPAFHGCRINNVNTPRLTLPPN